ncbi:MAG: hypothetical protein BGO14_00965 [Chlamydiales bacterium 38-26]|nr:hypothetical protein [Chlamydiales bacterium]OJV07292.1 MAG: hypothetical protein BGO14_00965 [Chlamydiales bacterium 38-26]
MKDIKLEYSVGSDLNYEDLVADIGYDTNLIALLIQDEGFENLRIRLYPPKNGEMYWDLNLKDFLAVIQDAKQRLWQLRKTDNTSNSN